MFFGSCLFAQGPSKGIDPSHPMPEKGRKVKAICTPNVCYFDTKGGLAQLVERSLSINLVLNAKGRVFDSCSLHFPFSFFFCTFPPQSRSNMLGSSAMIVGSRSRGTFLFRSQPFPLFRSFGHSVIRPWRQASSRQKSHNLSLSTGRKGHRRARPRHDHSWDSLLSSHKRCTVYHASFSHPSCDLNNHHVREPDRPLLT